ncbi:hypothetical protein H310_15259 [Aphanomyces invadans]|uniref:DUF4219 domain-containing protein n=1 Tax=Aphanomyces invadans TaxID=157072 RepID=A0A024T7L1_9STRA|nr:hypothetical protein H310_15259 [Aphanomyces invadans]ETV89900.1 hypothetical protein H310_15259 [Aphanomyces invadans]|eukprot:XP_008881468.1 hypothetical protein H310_15259 [Aphanomyces invadans]
MSPTTNDNIKAEPIVFRGANFNIFKVRIQAKLRSKNLWTIVNGDEKRTDDNAAEFDPKEGKAFDLLVNSLDDDNLAYADVSHVIHELHTKVYVTEMRGLQQKLLLMGRVSTTRCWDAREPAPTLKQITDRLLAKESEARRVVAVKRKVEDDQVMYTSKEGAAKPWKNGLSIQEARCGQGYPAQVSSAA